VAKPEWGKKHLCPSCGTKFYDLKRSPITCPSCGTKVEPETAGGGKKKRGGGRAAAAAAPAAPEPAVADAEQSPEVETVHEGSLEGAESEESEEQEEYSDVIEDTSELGEEGGFGGVVDEDEEGS